MPNAPSPVAPDTAAWLQARGAVDVRVDADGVIEFSARPLRLALTAAVRDLLPSVGLGVQTGAGVFGAVVPMK